MPPVITFYKDSSCHCGANENWLLALAGYKYHEYLDTPVDTLIQEIPLFLETYSCKRVTYHTVTLMMTYYDTCIIPLAAPVSKWY